MTSSRLLEMCFYKITAMRIQILSASFLGWGLFHMKIGTRIHGKQQCTSRCRKANGTATADLEIKCYNKKYWFGS